MGTKSIRASPATPPMVCRSTKNANTSTTPPARVTSKTMMKARTKGSQRWPKIDMTGPNTSSNDRSISGSFESRVARLASCLLRPDPAAQDLGHARRLASSLQAQAHAQVALWVEVYGQHAVAALRQTGRDR